MGGSIAWTKRHHAREHDGQRDSAQSRIFHDFLYVYDVKKTHNMKFTILTIVKCTMLMCHQTFILLKKNSHSYETDLLSSYKSETPYPFNNSLLLPDSSPW